MTSADPIDEWKADMANYDQNRTSLGFTQEYAPRVNAAIVKASESSYNPILQKYTNPQEEAAQQHFEAERAIETLAQNKVIRMFKLSGSSTQV